MTQAQEAQELRKRMDRFYTETLLSHEAQLNTYLRSLGSAIEILSEIQARLVDANDRRALELAKNIAYAVRALNRARSVFEGRYARAGRLSNDVRWLSAFEYIDRSRAFFEELVEHIETTQLAIENARKHIEAALGFLREEYIATARKFNIDLEYESVLNGLKSTLELLKTNADLSNDIKNVTEKYMETGVFEGE